MCNVHDYLLHNVKGAFVADRVLEISNLSRYHLKWTMTAFAPVYIKVNSTEIFVGKNH